MRLPGTILVPVDLAAGAAEALAYACELGRQLGARVHLLTVIGLPPLGTPDVGGALTAPAIDGLVASQRKALEQLAANVRCAELGDVLLRTGDARDVICQTAKELGADLIVMATHGRHGVSRALLGSVANAVVRAAPCPVLTLRIHAMPA